MSIVVTVVDTETGERGEQIVRDGNFVLIAVSPCYLAGEQHHANGTTVLTLKGRSPEFMATSEVAITEAADVG